MGRLTMRMIRLSGFGVALSAWVMCLSLCGAETQSNVRERDYRVVHVYVPLCDNKHQGIVKVSDELGNGSDPKRNLYWGALYGVKTFFESSPLWELLSTAKSDRNIMLDRAVFRSKEGNTTLYVVAEAYDGAYMKSALMDFFNAAAGKGSVEIELKDGNETILIESGGSADMVCFVGHNGLMDVSLRTFPENAGESNPSCSVVLACKSYEYFAERLEMAECPLLIATTQLMCPEAYTLDAIIRSWGADDEPSETVRKAGEAYAKYQKISRRSGIGVFRTGVANE